MNKKLGCRREAARCFEFVRSQLQHTAQFFITSYAASDLLVHKILLNSVLLSPIVSGGVRQKLPGQTPLRHNSLVFLPLEGRLGSERRLIGQIGSGVRVSVSFRQTYPPGFVLRCPTPKNRRFHVPQPTFLYFLETFLRISRNVLQGWKDNSMLAKPLAACTYLSSIVSEFYNA